MSDYAQRGVMLVDMRLISSESHSEASGYLGSIPDCRQPFTSAWRNETDAWQADENRALPACLAELSGFAGPDSKRP